MKIPAWLTITITGIAAAGAAVAPIIPPPYGAAVAGAIATLGALYHLFQPAPATK